MEMKHESVLLTEAVEGLDIKENDVVVDGTIGGAGHFSHLLEALGPSGTLIGIDADSDAVERAQKVVDSVKGGPKVHLVTNNFRNLGSVLSDLEIPHISKALFDLGWSSFHLSRGRGFSFKADEALLMTYGEPEAGKTAADLINSATEEELSEIIFTYGEERFARAIAKGIVRSRKEKAILTTFDLVAIIEASVPGWYTHRRLHPATKTFQALRIAVNDELGALREGLTTAMERLVPGGRIAVITFHSIEDRIVKQMFRDAVYTKDGSLVNRKPIVPGDIEARANPRARSGKLRIFERCIHSKKITMQEARPLSYQTYV